MNKSSNFFPLLIVGALFFILGFITWLNGLLIPYLKTACELTNFQALFVAFAFYISFTLMALPSSWILKKIGFKSGMSLGLFIMSLGALVFIPAANTRDYTFFLTGLFILGTGIALLQTAVNPYVTILGPIDSAAKRISIMGICNKVAGALAPLILAYFIVREGDDEMIKTLETIALDEKLRLLDEMAERVIVPYMVMAAVLFLLALAIRFIHLPDLKSEDDDTKNEKSGEIVKTSVFQFPYLILGVIALFFYVGVEVIAGDTIIRYGESLGIELNVAKVFTTYTLTAMLVGYILGIILIPKYISQRKALQASAILGIIFSFGAIFTDGFTSVFFIAILGLANALVWPAIWPLAIHGLGKFINTGSALLIMAISGGAIIPLLWGKIADLSSPREAYWIMIPSYLIILLYATKGYKIKKW
ncbi:sugar MFS transporter [Namhaeicola litoreus]|uniref:Sugar MFS transporter n=1 Tax=Namhaeicola litoreus TaxID=1052145 RepID=A0ABW3Y3I1_9FLAO